MKLMKVGAVLLLVQAICMEIGAFIMLLVAIVIQKPSIYSEHVSFALPYLQQNLVLFMIMAGIFGLLRLIGAVGYTQKSSVGLSTIDRNDCGNFCSYDIYAPVKYC